MCYTNFFVKFITFNMFSNQYQMFNGKDEINISQIHNIPIIIFFVYQKNKGNNGKKWLGNMERKNFIWGSLHSMFLTGTQILIYKLPYWKHLPTLHISNKLNIMQCSIVLQWIMVHKIIIVISWVIEIHSFLMTVKSFFEVIYQKACFCRQRWFDYKFN